MRSYIVRVYRRRGGLEFSGTVEAVAASGAEAGRPPQAFASAGDLLSLMKVGVPAAAAPSTDVPVDRAPSRRGQR